MVEFLRSTPHNVRLNGLNLGHRAPWLSGLVTELGLDTHFIVTDPDVVPSQECPTDVLELFYTTLNQYPAIDKVGFSLRLDDLPEQYAHRDDVILWETQFWKNIHPSGFFVAEIDTTFAMYRPGSGHQNGNSLRSAPPFTARHLPWYQDSTNLSEEDAYYIEHSDHLITNWNSDKLPATVRAQLIKLRAQQSAAE